MIEEKVEEMIEKANEAEISKEISGKEHIMNLNNEREKEDVLIKTLNAIKKANKFVNKNRKTFYIIGGTSFFAFFLGLSIPPNIGVNNLKKEVKELKNKINNLKEGSFGAEYKKSLEATSRIALYNSREIEKLIEELRATKNSVRDNAVDISLLEEKIREEGWNTYMKALAHDKEIAYSLQNQLYRLKNRIRESISTFRRVWENKLKGVDTFLSRLGDFEQELKQKMEPRLERIEEDIKEYNFGDRIDKAIKKINKFQKELRKFKGLESKFENLQNNFQTILDLEQKERIPR